MATDIFEALANNPFMLGPAGLPRYRPEFRDVITQHFQQKAPRRMADYQMALTRQLEQDTRIAGAQKDQQTRQKLIDQQRKQQEQQRRQQEKEARTAFKQRQQREAMDFDDRLTRGEVDFNREFSHELRDQIQQQPRGQASTMQINDYGPRPNPTPGMSARSDASVTSPREFLNGAL